MEEYTIYRNGLELTQIFVSVDGTIIDVFIKWLKENGYEGMYELYEDKGENSCIAKVNENLWFLINPDYSYKTKKARNPYHSKELSLFYFSLFK